MQPASYKTDEVFGISRDLPLNYTNRQSADNFLIENLTRDKHLVIYGSSKQGKTCLRKHCLRSSDYIVVHCSNKWTLAELHAAILKASGYEVTQSSTRTASGKQKVLAKVGASIFGNKAEGGAEFEKDNVESKTTSPLELDPEDVNDIISALKNLAFDKYIVLEDFHYLSFETQKDFSVALKAFHEASKFCFLIVGVWLEENRLTVYNGDLTGRVVSINADKWTQEELAQVMDAGEKRLNIKFADSFRQDLLNNCFENVYLVQEACYRCCKTEKIFQTQVQVSTIGESLNCKQVVSDVVNEQTGRFNSFITQFSDGFQDTTLEMYRTRCATKL